MERHSPDIRRARIASESDANLRTYALVRRTLLTPAITRCYVVVREPNQDQILNFWIRLCESCESREDRPPALFVDYATPCECMRIRNRDPHSDSRASQAMRKPESKQRRASSRNSQDSQASIGASAFGGSFLAKILCWRRQPGISIATERKPRFAGVAGLHSARNTIRRWRSPCASRVV